MKQEDKQILAKKRKKKKKKEKRNSALHGKRILKMRKPVKCSGWPYVDPDLKKFAVKYIYERIREI